MLWNATLWRPRKVRQTVVSAMTTTQNPILPCRPCVDFPSHHPPACLRAYISRRITSSLYMWDAAKHGIRWNFHFRIIPNWFLYSSRAALSNSGSTSPLWGSVPKARRNKRMCGSGLLIVKKTSVPRGVRVYCLVWIISFKKGIFLSQRTGGSHNETIPETAGHQFPAILLPTIVGSWARSWLVPWEEWHDCQKALR
jgi:hypothetical protein